MENLDDMLGKKDEIKKMHEENKKSLNESKDILRKFARNIYIIIFLVGAFFIFLAFGWYDYENVSAMFMNIGTEIFGVLISFIIAYQVFMRYGLIITKVMQMEVDLPTTDRNLNSIEESIKKRKNKKDDNTND